MAKQARISDVTSTTGQWKMPFDVTATREVVAVDTGKASADGAGETEKVEAAVYSYIKAIRSLGRTTVNTAEIASALGISIQEVDRSVASLLEKGVKVAG